MKRCSAIALVLASAAGATPAKKELYRAQKALDSRSAARGRVGVVTIYNEKTREALAISDGQVPTLAQASALLPCPFTGEQAYFDVQLLATAVAAARTFRCNRVEVVSGYRSPKYNRLLRKKGREVAQHSLHTLGRALDFRIPGVSVAELRRFLGRRGSFGVGLYPHSDFIHVDSGPPRRWVGW